MARNLLNHRITTQSDKNLLYPDWRWCIIQKVDAIRLLEVKSYVAL